MTFIFETGNPVAAVHSLSVGLPLAVSFPSV
jgi:hypothetical protein